MKKLPKYWYVLYKNEDEFNEINKYYCKSWGYNTPTNINKYGYVNISFENNWYVSRTAKDVYKNYALTEITFEEWQVLVCGKPSVSAKTDLTKLLHILKYIEEYGK